MSDRQRAAVSLAARTAAGNLRVDAVTAEVLRAFAEAGVESRLLKGPSIGRWLYEADAPRGYMDSDLLVRPDAIPRARDVLSSLGFLPELDERAMPEWWREHAVGWLRAADGAVVDVHRTLAGVGAGEEQLWRALAAEPATLIVAGHPAPTLPRAGVLFHLVLHAAQHGPEWGGTGIEDLRRALDRAEAETWRAAAALAAELDATPAFAIGLRMLPDGAALADRLGLPADLPADVALRAAGSVPPVALGFEQIARARGMRARVRVVAGKAFPPPTFMRHWTPLARRGRGGLAAAYLLRPLWLLAHAPRGFRAWWRARR